MAPVNLASLQNNEQGHSPSKKECSSAPALTGTDINY